MNVRRTQGADGNEEQQQGQDRNRARGGVHRGSASGGASRFKAETGDRLVAAQVEQLKRLAGK